MHEFILFEDPSWIESDTTYNAKTRQSDGLPRFLLSVRLTQIKVFDFCLLATTSLSIMHYLNYALSIMNYELKKGLFEAEPVAEGDHDGDAA